MLTNSITFFCAILLFETSAQYQPILLEMTSSNISYCNNDKLLKDFDLSEIPEFDTMCNIPLPKENQNDFLLENNVIPILCMGLYDASERLCSLYLKGTSQVPVVFPPTIDKFSTIFEHISSSEQFSLLKTFCSNTVKLNSVIEAANNVTAFWWDILNNQFKDEHKCMSLCRTNEDNKVQPLCSFIIWSYGLYNNISRTDNQATSTVSGQVQNVDTMTAILKNKIESLKNAVETNQQTVVEAQSKSAALELKKNSLPSHRLALAPEEVEMIDGRTSTIELSKVKPIVIEQAEHVPIKDVALNQVPFDPDIKRLPNTIMTNLPIIQKKPTVEQPAFATLETVDQRRPPMMQTLDEYSKPLEVKSSTVFTIKNETKLLDSTDVKPTDEDLKKHQVASVNALDTGTKTVDVGNTEIKQTVIYSPPDNENQIKDTISGDKRPQSDELTKMLPTSTDQSKIENLGEGEGEEDGFNFEPAENEGSQVPSFSGEDKQGDDDDYDDGPLKTNPNKPVSPSKSNQVAANDKVVSEPHKDNDEHEQEILLQDHFIEAEDSHFFTYFLCIAVLTIMAYLVFHNKKKLVALAVEGRRTKGSRRRPNSSNYSKLDCSLEEAMASKTTASVTHILY